MMTDDLIARMNALAERAAERKRQASHEGKEEEKPTAPAVPLPFWPDTTRGVPNGFLRSALFGAIGKGRRRFLKGEQIASLEGIEIHYTGERLDQGDLDVYESILHLLRGTAMGEPCRVTSYALLKVMGKTDTGKNRKTLQTRIERLRANAIRMKQGRYTFIGGLIDDALKDEVTQEWIIVLNTGLRALYGSDQFTQLDWCVRQALAGHPLAQWLHGFYASHAAPYPMRVDTLLTLSGSENTNPRSAYQKLRNALHIFVDASATHGDVFSYSICGDLVRVEKQAKGVQRRHLARKNPKKH